MALVRTDGAVYEIDESREKVSPTAATGECREWTVAPAEWPRSVDGEKLYIGYGGMAANGMSVAAGVRAMDTTTWVESRSVQTSVPFWRSVASPDGKYIYATVPEQHRILVLDAESLQERRVITVGRHPSLALVAPPAR